MKLFLKYNPAIWFVIVFAIILLIIIIYNFSDFPFHSLNLFTLLWTYPLIIMIHFVLRYKSFDFSNGISELSQIIKWLKRITCFYLPYLLIAIIYENLGIVIEIVNTSSVNYDKYFMHIDQLLFSVQPTIWLQHSLHPLAIEYFMLAYSMFFIYPFFYLIYLLHKNRIEYFQKVMFAEVLIVIISLSCFILFPTYGPRFVLDSSSPLFIQQIVGYSKSLQGISIPFLFDITGYNTFYNMQVDLWNYLERIKTDCFPSLHTSLCLLCLMYAIRFREVFKNQKLSMWFWNLGVVSLIVSTVYLRYHWVVDVIAAIVLTLVVYYFTEWIFNKWLKFREKHNLDLNKDILPN